MTTARPPSAISCLACVRAGLLFFPRLHSQQHLSPVQRAAQLPRWGSCWLMITSACPVISHAAGEPAEENNVCQWSREHRWSVLGALLAAVFNCARYECERLFTQHTNRRPVSTFHDPVNRYPGPRGFAVAAKDTAKLRRVFTARETFSRILPVSWPDPHLRNLPRNTTLPHPWLTLGLYHCSGTVGLCFFAAKSLPLWGFVTYCNLTVWRVDPHP